MLARGEGSGTWYDLLDECLLVRIEGDSAERQPGTKGGGKVAGDLLRAPRRHLRELFLRGCHQILDDLGHRLDLPREGDALPRHARPALDVPVDHGPPQGAHPELP